jgi:hypothetical protein
MGLPLKNVLMTKCLRRIEMGIWYDDGDEYCTHVSARKIGHPLGHGAPHIPNKQEAKELRRLMKKSGQTEEQVRADIVNRRRLAEARKSPTQGNRSHRYNYELKRQQKWIAKTKSLPGYHPDVQKELKEVMTRRSLRGFFR